jgi:hypothetical protein
VSKLSTEDVAGAGLRLRRPCSAQVLTRLAVLQSQICFEDYVEVFFLGGRAGKVPPLDSTMQSSRHAQTILLAMQLPWE